MPNLHQAADILTSNLLYPQIMSMLTERIDISNALLLVPGTSIDSLTVVDAVGETPPSLNFLRVKSILDQVHGIMGPVSLEITGLAIYNNVIKFITADGIHEGYLLYSGTLPEPANDFNAYAGRIAHLFRIKNAFDSLSKLQDNQAKLKYELNFFANTVINIFEPYDQGTLIQLFMEIISEMYTLPAALTLEVKGPQMHPLYAKGLSMDELTSFILETEPFLRNRSHSMFPTVLNECAFETECEHNHNVLNDNCARLLIPLTIEGEFRYLIVCMSTSEIDANDLDKLVLNALNSTFNKALELSNIRDRLMSSNRELDKKVFSLTTVYQASQQIFSRSSILDTLDVSLDMLMEIFQSAVSGVLVNNSVEERMELLHFKSVLHTEPLSYWLKPPQIMPDKGQVFVHYNNPDEREEFDSMFPDFVGLAEHLKPYLIIQLFSQQRYYGFISLSERVTGQTYSQEDMDLLLLLADSIKVALDNSWMVNELQDKNYLLDRQLRNIYAIQDVIKVIRQASDMADFCALTATALEFGVGATGIAILSNDTDGVKVIHGEFNLEPPVEEQILNSGDSSVIEIDLNGCPKSVLVVSLVNNEKAVGYFIIRDFYDTVLEDSERVQLLETIAAIQADAFAHFQEQMGCVFKGVVDYPSLIVKKLMQSVRNLTEYGLHTKVIKFQHDDPVSVLQALNEKDFGLVIEPGIGIIVSHVNETDLKAKLAEHTNRFKFVRQLTKDNLFSLRV
ncbi:MAG: hypothetical protein ACM3UZ_00475 [Acidobacteriota bacterium]